MRKMTRTLAVIAGAALFICAADVGVGLAANNATATVTGTVVAPIAITTTADFDFGKFVAGISGGTLTLATTGTRTVTGDTILVGGTTGVPATFNVTGALNTTYTITLPSNFNLSDGNGHNMAVNTFVASPATGTLGGTGAETVKVGATVTVDPSQVQGVYTNNASFVVTVNYN